MIRSLVLALPLIALAQAASATKITKPVSAADLGFTIDVLTVFEPIPATPFVATPKVTRPVSAKELGLSIEDLRVIEPLRHPPAVATGSTPPLPVTPNSTLLWNDILGGRDFTATQIDTNTIAIDLPGIRGISPEDLGLPADTFFVGDDDLGKAPAPSLFDDALTNTGHTAKETFAGAIAINIPLSCSRTASPDGTLGPCFPESTDTTGRGGQVPAPGGLLLIAGFLGVLCQRARRAA